MSRLQRSASVLALIATVLVVAGCGSSGGKSTATTAATPQVAGGTGQTVDGIPCNRTEQLTYHEHAHLWLLVNGKSEPLHALIGIVGNGQCFYFLHTHDTTGVIHMEAPAKRVFTLGQVFDIWGQPLSRTQATNLKGPLHVFVGTKPYTGNPRDIKLTRHTMVTIEQGKVVKPPPFTFTGGL